MSYAAKATAGTTVSVTISGTPTVILGIVSFSGPGGDKAQIDTTPLNATAKTSVSGAMDWGSIDMQLMFDSTETAHTYIRTQASTANTSDTLTVASSDNGTETGTYTGYFKGWRMEYGKDAVILANVGFVCSGAPSFA